MGAMNVVNPSIMVHKFYVLKKVMPSPPESWLNRWFEVGVVHTGSIHVQVSCTFNPL